MATSKETNKKVSKEPKKEAKKAVKIDNTAAEIKKLSEIYDRDYFENGVATKKSNYIDYSWSRLGSYFQRTAQHITDKFSPEKSLDIGCAKGYLVKGLVDSGIDAFGIDPSEYALAESHSDIKDRLTKGIAQSIPFPDNSFDIVTYFDVLEHIPERDVPKVLQEMLRVTKKWVVLRVVTRELHGDIDAYHEFIRGKDWWHKQVAKAGGTVEPTDNFFNGAVWWFNVPEFLIVARKAIV